MCFSIQATGWAVLWARDGVTNISTFPSEHEARSAATEIRLEYGVVRIVIEAGELLKRCLTEPSA